MSDAAAPPVVLGVSLKMYFGPDRTAEWVRAVRELAAADEGVRSGAVELFVLPSLPSLPRTLDLLRGGPVGVGAQDLHWDDRGAVTGGISGADLAELGCAYAEINHAERRRIFHEDAGIAAAKLAAAVRNGLVPVICVGEQQRVPVAEAIDACADQLGRLLDDVPAALPRAVVAYEPEWAIGAAESASPDHVREVIGGIRGRLEVGGPVSEVSVIYGGSAGPGLLPRLGDADGLFLGRFAHDPAALAEVLADAARMRSVRT